MKAALIKENLYLGLAYRYHRKHGGAQAFMVPEKELKVLHLDPQATGDVCHTVCSLSVGDL